MENNKSLQQKRFIFADLDTFEQLSFLLKIFAPILLTGIILQYCLQINNNEIVSIIIIAFMIFVINIYKKQHEKIEIISEKDSFIRTIKMIVNVILGFIYFAIAIFIAAVMSRIFNNKIFENVNDDILFCVYVAYGLICSVFFVWLILWRYRNKLFLKMHESIIKFVHYLNIENDDFLLICSKKKKIEVRVADSRRRKIKVGDILCFRNIDNKGMNTDTEVTKINYAANLDELTKQINIKNTGYDNLNMLQQNYPIELQNSKGVVAIEFRINKK